jgi:hypothetical protein
VAYPLAFQFGTAANLAIDYLCQSRARGQTAKALEGALDVPSTAPSAERAVFASSGRSQVVELDVESQLLPGWDVIATYTHIDAEVPVADPALGSRKAILSPMSRCAAGL